MNKKRTGSLLILLSFSLLAIGIAEYLYSSNLYTGTIEGEQYSKNWKIKENDNSYLWYNVTLKKIELNFSISFSFQVESQQLIDFYIMSSSQYAAWENNGIPTATISKTNINNEQAVFYPTTNDTFYFVLDNYAYNTTKNISVKSNWAATVYLLNYSEALPWLLITLLGTVTFIIGSLLFGNPFNYAYRRISHLIRKSSNKSNQDLIIHEKVTKYSLITLWISIILPSAVLIAILLSKLFSLFEIPSEFSPIVLDLSLRIFLFYFFSLLAPMTACAAMSLLLFSFGSNIYNRFIQTRGIVQQHSMFQSLVLKYLSKNLVSRSSILCCILAVFIFVIGYSLQDAGFLLYMVVATILAIPFGRSLFTSSREACEELNIDWKQELKISKVYALNSSVLALWILVTLLTMIRIIIPSGALLGYNFFLDSSPLPLKADIFSFVPSVSDVNQSIDTVFSTVFLGAVIFFAVFISVEYHLLPIFASAERKKKKLYSLLFPIIVAIVSTATGNILVYIISPQSLSNPFIQLMLPLSSFVAGYLAEKAFEELEPKS